MKHLQLLLTALVTCLMLPAVNVSANEDQGFDVVETKIRALVPNAKTIAISETPIEGILQVQINNDIVYVSADGKYLLQGQIMDIDTKANIPTRPSPAFV